MDGSTATLEGFLSVVKPYGWTSHDVVNLVRRLAGTRRVGHAGTLDPAASGVLLVAVGRATRLVDYLAGQDKGYCGDVVLGAATTTDDGEGTVLYARDATSISLQSISADLAGFLGQIEQLPPQYSAVKLQGKKAYEIARAGGSAKLEPRRVEIKGLAVVGWEPPVLSLLVRCSKGTYIRSLARDLGERLGVGGHLGALVRLSSGPFDLDGAVGVEDLRLAAEFGYLGKLMYPPDVAVAHLPALILAGQHSEDMLAGRAWKAQPGGSPHPGPLPRGEGEGVGAGVPAGPPGPAHGPSGGQGRPPLHSAVARVYSEAGAFLGLAELVESNWQPRLVMGEA